MAEQPIRWHEDLERFEASVDALTEAIRVAKGERDADVTPTVRWRHESDDYEDLS